MASKLIITLDQSAERDSANRAKRLRPRGEPIKLNPVEKAVLFLRGVNSRAMMALPAFYLFLGARAGDHQTCAIEGYPGLVFKHAIEFSSIGTVSLACRKVFDQGTKNLTGGIFAQSTDETLKGVAEYWSKMANRSIQDALLALCLLRAVFQECAKADTLLLGATAPLCHRIGLLKQYANHSAAHLSLEGYEFSVVDCAHVVAALTMIGEIIRSFDAPQEQPTYYDTLDDTSLSAAIQLFPETPRIRLFEDIKIEMQARLCWQWGADRGKKWLLEELPYATGWF